MIEDDVTGRLNSLNKPGKFQYRVHLGGGFYCTVKSGWNSVHLQKYSLHKDIAYLVPSKMGIALRVEEWMKLVIHLKTIRKEYPELASAVPCYFTHYDSNREAA